MYPGSLTPVLQPLWQVPEQAFQDKSKSTVSGLDGKWTIHVHPIGKEAGSEQRTCLAVDKQSGAGDSRRAGREILQIMWNPSQTLLMVPRMTLFTKKRRKGEAINADEDKLENEFDTDSKTEDK